VGADYVALDAADPSALERTVRGLAARA